MYKLIAKENIFLKKISTIILTSQILIFLSCPSFSQSNDSSKKNNFTFHCEYTEDMKSGDLYPATIAKISNFEEKKVEETIVFFWKDYYLVDSGYPPHERCQIVSDKMQKFYSEGRLNPVNGENNGYQVICVVSHRGEECNDENQLFQIKNTDNPNLVLLHLMNLTDGEYTEPIYQNSGRSTYVDLEKLLNNSSKIKAE